MPALSNSEGTAASFFAVVANGLRRPMRLTLLLTLMFAFAAVRAFAQEKNPYAGDAKIAKLGEYQFRLNCAFCHGLGARGGGRGPDLTRAQKRHGNSDAEMFHNIHDGIPGTAMPAATNGGIGVGMSDEEIITRLIAVRGIGCWTVEMLLLFDLGRPDVGVAVRDADALGERFAALRARGDRVHLREEARYTLEIEGKPDAALALALDDWRVQKEPLDARIVLEAALAAHKPAAAREVVDWIAATHLEGERLAALAQQANTETGR